MLDEIEIIIKDACYQNNVGFYDFEVINATKGRILLIYITKVGGVSITDCQNVSKRISYYLDEKNIFNKKYFLEVSSPGLERELKKKKHYISAINEKIKVRHNEAGKIISETGILKEVFPDYINIKTEDKIISIQYNNIKRTKTIFDLKNNLKRK